MGSYGGCLVRKAAMGMLEYDCSVLACCAVPVTW